MVENKDKNNNLEAESVPKPGMLLSKLDDDI